MDSYQQFGIMVILKESLKVLSKSRNQMAYIASLTILLNTLFYFSNAFSAGPLISDLLFKSTILSITTLTSSDISRMFIGPKYDSEILVSPESFFFLAFFVVSLFSVTSTILVSSATFQENNLSFKDLAVRVGKSWIRPFITCFHTSLYGVGYFFFVLVILIPILVVRPPITSQAVMTVVSIIFFILWLYLSTVWVLAIVVSVMEEGCYGIEALGRAGGVIKGKKLHGVVLTLLFTVLGIIEIMGFDMVGLEKSRLVRVIVGLIMINFTCLMNVFQYICFTVLYIQCKKSVDEEMELQGSVEYGKLPTMPPVGGDKV